MFGRQAALLCSPLNVVTLAVLVVLASFMLLLGPFAAFEMTGTSELLAPNWGDAWSTASVVYSCIACCAGIYACLLVCQNKLTSWCLLWIEVKARLSVTIWSCLTYSVAAALLVPAGSYVLWLVFRTLLIVFLRGCDVVVVFQRLRMTLDTFRNMYGGEEKAKFGRTSFGAMVGLAGFLALDVCHHWIMFFNADERPPVSFKVVHPVSGRTIDFTNLMIAQATYFTSALFAATNLSKLLRSQLWH